MPIKTALNQIEIPKLCRNGAAPWLLFRLANKTLLFAWAPLFTDNYYTNLTENCKYRNMLHDIIPFNNSNFKIDVFTFCLPYGNIQWCILMMEYFTLNAIFTHFLLSHHKNQHLHANSLTIPLNMKYKAVAYLLIHRTPNKRKRIRKRRKKNRIFLFFLSLVLDTFFVCVHNVHYVIWIMNVNFEFITIYHLFS